MSSSGPNRSSRSAIASGRLGRIVRGYLGACFIAAWVLPFGLILEDLVAGRRVSGRFTDFGIVVGGFFLVMLVSAAPLATAAIVVTESYRVRLIWPYLGAGAVIGVLIQFASGFIGPSSAAGTHMTANHWTILPLAAVVGAIAGAVYWAIAVRGYRPPQLRD
jgi:predicted anti-sigma-YlaC factor YlaD